MNLCAKHGRLPRKIYHLRHIFMFYVLIANVHILRDVSAITEDGSAHGILCFTLNWSVLLYCVRTIKLDVRASRISGNETETSGA